MYYQQNPQQTQGQNFYEIKANCLSRQCLFEDRQFPATNSSLFVHGTSSRYRGGTIYWKRPSELVKWPMFFANGVSRFDVIQGELGNCWFIAAVSNLTLHPNLFEHVVPIDNTFEPGHYCGAFHFRFWCFGHWMEVIVDDRLPCNSRGELLYMQSQDKNEFWSCLLEKAYAKLHGSYESLSGGVPSEALQDFSGGIVEIIDIREFTSGNSFSELYSVLSKAHFRQSLMTCALHGRSANAREERTRQGLVLGHAYSVTAVLEVPLYQGVQLAQLLRIRNPWGDFEWNGAWSDRSQEWNMVDPNFKARVVGLTKRNDGEFWMSVEDFASHYHRLEICHLSPDPVSQDIRLQNAQVPWKKMMFMGSWVPGQSAGGCLNNSSFYKNPQYFFDFTASDVDGDANKCTVIVSLIQRTECRTFTRKEGVGKFCIGFRVFRVSKYTGLLGMDFFQRESSRSLGSGPYTNSREISGRFELSTGTYCIVPSTFERDIGGSFMLRIFSEPPPPNRPVGVYQNQNQYTPNYNAPPPMYPPQQQQPPFQQQQWQQMHPPQMQSFATNPSYAPPPVLPPSGPAAMPAPPAFQQPTGPPPSTSNYGWNI